jgi:hypothetical protein
MRLSRSLIIAMALASASLPTNAPAAAATPPCLPRSIAVDTSLADTGVFPFDCRGYGETFAADDTLVQSLSVWRPAPILLDAQPHYLFIFDVLPDGVPNVDQRIVGPLGLVNLQGDGIQPTEYRWVFDPPLSLPHRGEFLFDVFATRNNGFNLLASSLNRIRTKFWGVSDVRLHRAAPEHR